MRVVPRLPQRELDLTNPDHARRFLRGFRLPNGAKVLEVTLEDGRVVDLTTASDEQICMYASQIYTAMYAARGSKCYYEEDPLEGAKP